VLPRRLQCIAQGRHRWAGLITPIRLATTHDSRNQHAAAPAVLKQQKEVLLNELVFVRQLHAPSSTNAWS
jgi:hypothetical protein